MARRRRTLRSLEWERRYRAKRRAKGLANDTCYRCDSKKFEYSNMCYEHWTSSQAYNAFGTRARNKELQALIKKYRHRCAYTGIRLFAGKDLSFDHVKPVCTLAQRARSEVVPCHIAINKMRGALPIKDFKELLKQIAANIDKLI